MIKSDLLSIPHYQALALSAILERLSKNTKTRMNIRMMKNNTDLIITLLEPRTIITISKGGRAMYTVDDNPAKLLYEPEPLVVPVAEPVVVIPAEPVISPTVEQILEYSQIELIHDLFKLGFTGEDLSTNTSKKILQIMLIEKLELKIPEDLTE